MAGQAYRIREVRVGDAAALSELFQEFISQPSAVDVLAKQIERLVNDAHYFVAVACEHETVIGTAMGIVCYDLVGNCDPFLVIENVVVAAASRGLGVGKLLVRALEAFGQANRCNYILLVSGEKYTRAHRFYEALGYEKHLGFKKRLKAQVETVR